MNPLLRTLMPAGKRAREKAELEAKLLAVRAREEKLKGRVRELEAAAQAAPKYLIAKTANLGLGNRLLFLVGCVVMSRHSGRRIIVDWREGMYAPAGENSFWNFFEESESFQIREFGFLEDAPPEDFVRPEWSGKLRLSIEEYHRHLREMAWEAEFETDPKLPKRRWKGCGFFNSTMPERILVAYAAKSLLGLMAPGDLAKLYPGMDRDQVISHVFRHDFRLAQPLRERLEGFVREHFGQGRVLGVHFRFTDRRPEEGLDELRQRVAAICEGIRAETGEWPRIFLATDDEVAQASFRDGLEADLIVQPKWFDASKRPLHLTERLAGDDRREMGMQAILDIYLLAACTDLFVQHSSSFSRVAAYLTEAPRERVHWHSTDVDLDWES